MKTGLNEAFVIDGKKRAELIAADPQSAEIIKPLAVGDDVRRWHLRDKDRYLIFARRGTNIEQYPAILAHLQQYRDRLEPRPRDWISGRPWSGRKPGSYKWFEIQDDVAYFREFDQPKIIYPEISMTSRFAYDTTGKFFNNKAFIIPTRDLYLLGVLSTSIVWEYLNSVCSSVQGNALELKGVYLSKLPIPVAADSIRQEVSDLVAHCLKCKGASCEAVERKIEGIVRQLYGLPV